jgi:hypothetical protein
MTLRLTGLVGALATACALALAACGGDEKTVETVTDTPGSARPEKTASCLEDDGYEASVGHVTAASRRDGATGIVSVPLNLESGSAVDNLVQVYFWNSRENATGYVRDVGDGPLDDLHHEQLGTATITYAHGHSYGAEEMHHSHGAGHAEDTHDDESEAIDHEVQSIAACVA